MENWTVGTLRDNRNRLAIRYAVLPPRDEDDVRWLVLVNGRTEYVEKYHYLPEDLELPPNWGVITWDHRGQGASGGARSYVDTYEDFISDAVLVVNKIVGEDPYYILAHSMGGLISLSAVLSRRLSPEHLILSSPLFGLRRGPLPEELIRPLSGFIHQIGFGVLTAKPGGDSGKPFENNRLTHNEEKFDQMKASGYRARGVTFGWVSATFNTLEKVNEEGLIRQLSCDMTVIMPSHDPIVNTESCVAWVDKAKGLTEKNVDLHLIKGARHELLSEIPRYYHPTLELIKEGLAL